MCDLFYLSDLSQLNATLEVLSRGHVVTGSLAVASELERLGIPFSDELACLEPDEIAHHLMLAYQLTDGWWDEELADTEFMGFSLAQAARQDWALAFELCLNARVAYERLFTAKSVRRVQTFSLSPQAMCRTGPAPAFRPALSLTRAIMLWLANRMDIPVTHFETPRPAAGEGHQWRPRLTRDDLKSAVSSASAVADTGTAGRKERLVLVWKSGLWLQEIDELERAFTSLPGWRMLKLTERELSLGETSVQKHRRHQAEQKLHHAWQVYESSLAGYSARYPEIFGNRHLHFQFARIFAEMNKAVRLGLSFDSLLETLQPSLIIFGHEAFTIERTLVQIARRKKIPTVGFIHGGLQPKFGRLGVVGDADHIMVWGPNDIRELTWAGIAPERLSEVGSLRFERSYRAFSAGAGNKRIASEKIEARQTLGLQSHHPVVLLLTAPTSIGLAQAAADPRAHRMTWRALVALAHRRPDFTFAIKTHPAYDCINFYRGLCDRGPRNFVLLKLSSLQVALEASDVAVLVNYCTTAALEAMLARVPVLFIREAIYDTEMHQDVLSDHGAILVSSTSELEKTIDRLSNDAQYRQEALEDARQVLCLLLGDHQESALERTMVELQKIALPSQEEDTKDISHQGNGIERQLINMILSLRESNDTEHFISSWQICLEALEVEAQKQPGQMENLMSNLSSAIAYTLSDVKHFCNVTTICLGELGRRLCIPQNIKEKMILRTFLLGMIKRIDARCWAQARSLARHGCLQAPHQALCEPLFWELLVRASVDIPMMLPFLNFLDRSRHFLATLLPSRSAKSDRR